MVITQEDYCIGNEGLSMEWSRAAVKFNDLTVFAQSCLVVAVAVIGADLLTLLFYSIFFADRLLLDLLLSSIIVAVVGFPLSYLFLGRSAAYAQLLGELERTSRIDELTGILNRKTFLSETKRRLLKVAEHEDGVHTLLFMDADHFKSINDKFGHSMGDAVLCELARAIEASIGKGDLAGRIGGEEFAVLLTGTDEATPLQICDHIRERVKKIPLAVDLPPGTVTVSIGTSRHRRGQVLETLLEEADSNLYAAKASGRDRAVHAGKFGGQPD